MKRKYPTAVDASIAAEFVDDRADQLGESVPCLLAPLSAADVANATAAGLPTAWVQALAARTWAEAGTHLGWPRVAQRMPATQLLFEQRLRGLGVLLPANEPATLLYFLIDVDDEIVAFEGHRPMDEARLKRLKLPADLADFCRIHDGWFEFHSGELGPMSHDDWEAYGEDADDLTVVAMNGPGSLGFRKQSLDVHVVWSDVNQVEDAASVLAVLDDWVSHAIDDED